MLHHLDGWTDFVSVSQRSVLTNDPQQKRVMLLSKADADDRISLCKFIHCLSDYLPDLNIWRGVRQTSGQAVRRQQQAVCDSGVAPLVPPTVSGSCLSIVKVPDHSGALADARPTRDEDAVSVLSQLASVERAIEADVVPFSRLEGVTVGTLVKMKEDGAVRLETDDFGELVVSIRSEGVRYVNVQAVSNPAQIISLPTVSTTSKLDMTLALIRQGWTVGRPGHPYREGADRSFYSDWRRPASYFNCLVHAELLMGKGVPSIPHNYKDIQYLALLRLQGDALQEFLRKQDEGFDDAWCRKHVKLFGEKHIPSGPEDEPPSDEDEPDDPGIAPLNLPPVLPSLDVVPLADWQRARVSVLGSVEHRVVMDHSTGGQQRAYIVCKHGPHGHCIRWATCSSAETRHVFCAQMLAWALDAPRHADRGSHMDNDPPPSKVVEVASSIVIEDY